MKASEIIELSPGEMERKLVDLKQEMFNLRFQHASGQLENPGKLRETRRDIARVKTVIRQTQSNEKE